MIKVEFRRMPDERRHYRAIKHALRRRDLVDPFFVGKLSFSPYHACRHGCVYCDGRAERYFVEGDFSTDIVVRSNIATVLDTELRKLRERGTVFIGSGVSDAYQAPERDEQLTRACARVLCTHGLPAALLTKSALAVRDLDLWREINANAGFTFMVSLQTLDEHLRQIFEPLASTCAARLNAITAFKTQGCAVGVATMPFLPMLSDHDEQIYALAKRLAELGVDYVLPGGLTLRPGRQKELFLATLQRTFPELCPHYQELYAENRASGAPLTAYNADLQQRAREIFHSVSLPIRTPHTLYQHRLPLYDEVYVLLHHMADLYTASTAAAHRLCTATARYQSWLLTNKKIFNRRRSLSADTLTAELVRLATSDELALLLDNARLATFLRPIIVERAVLDYRRLVLA